LLSADSRTVSGGTDFKNTLKTHVLKSAFDSIFSRQNELDVRTNTGYRLTCGRGVSTRQNLLGTGVLTVTSNWLYGISQVGQLYNMD